MVDAIADLLLERYGLTPHLLADCVTDAMPGGARRDASVYLEHAQYEELRFGTGKITHASLHETHGLSLRVLVGDEDYGAASDRVSRDALKRLVSDIRNSARRHFVARASGPRDDGGPHRSSGRFHVVGVVKADVAQLLSVADEAARNESPDVIDVGATVSRTSKLIAVATADGRLVGDDRPMTTLHVGVLALRDERRAEATASLGWRIGLDALPPQHLIVTCAKRAARQAINLLKASIRRARWSTPVRRGIVLAPGVSGSLCRLLVGHLLAGDFIARRQSPFASDFGRMIASPELTILDDGLIAGQFGSLRIDDEGTPGQTTPLIDKGVLVGAILDKKSALRLGRTSTGNGRREDHASLPLPQVTNLVVRAGPDRELDIIRSVDDGVYIAAVGSGQIDVSSGKFVFSVTYAEHIRLGHLAEATRGELIGDAREVLRTITAVGSEVGAEWSRAITGKDGQSLPCGVVGPAVRIDRGCRFNDIDIR